VTEHDVTTPAEERGPREDARDVDLGFSHFEGERRGRPAAVAALARWSALRALGARRPWTAKVVPVALVMLAFGPALVVLGVKALVGNRVDEIPEILPYDGYYVVIGITVIVFVAMTTPELVCPDRRDRVLDLYLATAVTPFEYVAGKVLAALVPILCLTLVPQTTLFFGNAIFDDDAVGYVRDNIEILFQIVVAGVLLGIYYSLIGLALSSLTDRRTFAVGGLLGLFLVSAIIAGTLGDLVSYDFQALAVGLAPIWLVTRIVSGEESGAEAGTSWLVVEYVAVVALSALVLVARYRRAAS
jgi:ABC-2 type transport system permease protein